MKSSPVQYVRERLALRLDRRAEDELSRDLCDEFDYHIRQIERELIAAGADPEAAAVEARRRFGDTARLRRECTRIARREERMLQKANTVLMILLLIAVTLLSWHVFVSQQDTTLALQDIRNQFNSVLVTQNGERVVDDAELEAQRARVEALTALITELLAGADPHAGGDQRITEVLHAAQLQLDGQFDLDPAIEARLRAAIRQAREAIESRRGERDERDAAAAHAVRVTGDVDRPGEYAVTTLDSMAFPHLVNAAVLSAPAWQYEVMHSYDREGELVEKTYLLKEALRSAQTWPPIRPGDRMHFRLMSDEELRRPEFSGEITNALVKEIAAVRDDDARSAEEKFDAIDGFERQVHTGAVREPHDTAEVLQFLASARESLADRVAETAMTQQWGGRLRRAMQSDDPDAPWALMDEVPESEWPHPLVDDALLNRLLRDYARLTTSFHGAGPSDARVEAGLRAQALAESLIEIDPHDELMERAIDYEAMIDDARRLLDTDPKIPSEFITSRLREAIDCAEAKLAAGG